MEKAIVQDENGLKKVEFSSTVGFVEVSKKELSIHFGLEEESIHLHQVFGNTNEGLSFEMPSSRRGEEVMFHLDFQFGKIFIVRGDKVSRVEDVADLEVEKETTSAKVQIEDDAIVSIVQLLKNLPLKNSLRNSFMLANEIKQVSKLPNRYDGNIMFELPYADPSRRTTGMESRFDGHTWSNEMTSNIPGFEGVVRYRKCGGHLQCLNSLCVGLHRTEIKNEKHWTGRLTRVCSEGSTTEGFGSLKCFYCKSFPTCISQCRCKLILCFPNEILRKKVSRGVIHTGHHMHPVAEGVSKQILDDVRERVSKMVSKEVGGGRPRSFQLKLAKEIVMESCLFQDHKGDAELCDKDLSALLVKLAPVIDKRSQEEFKLRCRAWKSAPSEEAAEQELDNLSTWLREGHADKTNTLALQTWLIWWHARVAHWDEYMMKAMQGDERYLIPRSNLAESMHGSWLASTDGVKYISLYNACYNDLVNTLIQQSKYDSYLKGGHIGCGPGLEKLKRRASTSAIPPAPREVIDLTNEAAIELEAANRRVSADGDSRSIRRKREGVLKNPIKDGDSHRPEYEYVTYNTQCHRAHNVLQGVQNEGEVEIHPTRLARGSTPCFEGLIETPSGTKKQLVWFCESNVAHTWEPSHNVIEKPTTRPALWPVALGTSLDSMEIIALLNAGFDLKDISAEAHQQVGETPFAVDNDIDVHPMHRNGKLVTIVRVVNKEMQDRIKRASELVCTIQRQRIVVPKEHVEYT
ncbi:hypothetical protein L7F22_007238 [Adiantum nelumboides]|nr:hypothetical protein [Adiantum nelumboides]